MGCRPKKKNCWEREGVKKSPFCSTSKRGHILMRGGVKNFFPCSILCFYLLTICGSFWCLALWKFSISLCVYFACPIQARGGGGKWEWTNVFFSAFFFWTASLMTWISNVPCILASILASFYPSIHASLHQACSFTTNVNLLILKLHNNMPFNNIKYLAHIQYHKILNIPNKILMQYSVQWLGSEILASI